MEGVRIFGEAELSQALTKAGRAATPEDVIKVHYVVTCACL